MHINIWNYQTAESVAYFYAKVCPPYMVGQDFFANGKKYIIKQIAHALVQAPMGRVLDSKLELYVMESE